MLRSSGTKSTRLQRVFSASSLCSLLRDQIYLQFYFILELPPVVNGTFIERQLQEICHESQRRTEIVSRDTLFLQRLQQDIKQN